MPTQERTQQGRAKQFAEYIRRAATEAGYDIDSPRGGGRKALAEATGMSPSSVGRMLAGQTLPEPSYLEALAGALRVPLMELLVRSGVVSRMVAPEISPSRPALGPAPLTPQMAAEQLGIKSEARVRMFVALVRTLLEEEERDRSEGAE